jgi:hypothetical protein
MKRTGPIMRREMRDSGEAVVVLCVGVFVDIV